MVSPRRNPPPPPHPSSCSCSEGVRLSRSSIDEAKTRSTGPEDYRNGRTGGPQDL